MSAITPRVEGTTCTTCFTRVERVGAYILCACSYESLEAWEASFCACGGLGYAQHHSACPITRA